MKLVIVESPTKAKTIEKMLKKDYTVLSSYGHVRDLPKSKFGIDLESFEPQYVIPTKARKNVTQLKKASQKSDEVILATDEDREGEAIAWHLSSILDLNNNNKGIKRIAFHEITEEAIENALKNPRAIDLNMVNAQQARRVLDRMVGYKLSPFLWEKIARGLSAGRVQSVALRLIVEREREIRAFKAEEYWEITALFTTEKGEKFESSLDKIDSKKVEVGTILNQESAEKIKSDLLKSKYKIEKVEEREIRKNPPAPFTTSTLQQEAYKKLHLSSKQTMMVAQGLYERGLITYMRTDSVNLSVESLAKAKSWIENNLGKDYLLPSSRSFKSKSKNAQEAHEAVRPTDPNKSPAGFGKGHPADLFKDKKEEKLYELIWKRFIACQLPQAIFNLKSIDISGKGEKEYNLRSSGTTLAFDGFLKVWPSKFEEKEIPQIKPEEKIKLGEITPSQHFTQPPARYNDASLVKTLEELGIGRPSTYASIISVIQQRNYVFKNEQRRLEPTEIGEKVNDILAQNFPKIMDTDFTAKMEDDLDKIAEGKNDWKKIIKDFYTPFAKELEEKYQKVKNQKPEPEETDEICEKCGKKMVIKFSRFGKFLACSGFPECKNAKSLTGEANQNGFNGKNYGKCPKCKEGNVIMRKTKKGRFFYGCSKYPDCDYASWKKPEGKEEE